MISNIIQIIESFILLNVSRAVFIGCILEQVIVPIPASFIVLTSTYLLLKGTNFSLASFLNLIIKIIIPASLGITLGSLVYYGLAFKIGMPFVERSSKYLGVSVQDVENIGRQVNESRYDDFFIFLARCLPIVPSIAINLFCGLIKYDLRKYLATTFLGSAVQILGWALLAWFSGNIYQFLENQISYLGNIMTLVIILLVIYYVLMKRRESKNNR